MLFFVFIMVSVGYVQEKPQTQPEYYDEEDEQAFEEIKKECSLSINGSLLSYVQFLKDYPDSKLAPEVKLWVEILKGNYDNYENLTVLTKSVAKVEVSSMVNIAASAPLLAIFGEPVKCKSAVPIFSIVKINSILSTNEVY